MPEKVEGKVTPEALQVIYLDEIASRLADLQESMFALEQRIVEMAEQQQALVQAQKEIEIERKIEPVEIKYPDELVPQLVSQLKSLEQRIIDVSKTQQAQRTAYQNELMSQLKSHEQRVLSIHKIQKAEITQGVLEGAEIAVTDQIKSVLRESGYKEKWYEMTIFNDGPDDVYISSSESKHSKPLIIKIGDQEKLTAKKGSRKDVYVWCNSGESATIRVAFER